MARQFGRVGPMSGANRAKTVVVFSFFGVILFIFVAISLLYSPPAPQPAEVKTVVIQKEAPVELVEVLVPAARIEGGKPLDPTLFRKEKRPKVAVTDRTIRDFEQIKGFYARSTIYPDQPLVNDYITQIRPVNSITTSIPVGFRAVTVTVNANTSVEGWAKAGARVDVAFTSSVNSQQAVTVIVQNAKILSADRMVEGAPPNPEGGAPVPTTITLLVSAKDAQKISLAQTLGALTLHLRGDNDGEKQATLTGTLTAKDLLGDSLGETGKDEYVQGYVRMLDEKGSYVEWIVKDGKRVRRELKF